MLTAALMTEPEASENECQEGNGLGHVRRRAMLVVRREMQMRSEY